MPRKQKPEDIIASLDNFAAWYQEVKGKRPKELHVFGSTHHEDSLPVIKQWCDDRDIEFLNVEIVQPQHTEHG